MNSGSVAGGVTVTKAKMIILEHQNQRQETGAVEGGGGGGEGCDWQSVGRFGAIVNLKGDLVQLPIYREL